MMNGLSESNHERIAIYVPSLGGGGAERIMVTLANGFCDHGLLVDFVLASAEGPYLKGLNPGVRIIDLGASRIITSLPKLVRYLSCERPKAMLSALNYVNVVVVLARMLANVSTRLVVSERCTFTNSSKELSKHKAWLLRQLMCWTYPKADAVIAISNGVAEDLAISIDLPRNSISVVYNPAVYPHLIEKSQESLDHPWFSPGSPPVIIGAGRLTYQKDFTTLLHAVAEVRLHRDVRLVILGEGEMRDELEGLVDKFGMKDDVLLPGFVDNPAPWMRNSSVFVLSSRYEGFGNVLVEAMAVGTPVISTDCPSGPSEILEGGVWGALVPVGEVRKMAEAIINTLDQVIRPDVAERAQEFGIKQPIKGYMKALGIIGS